MDIMTSHFMAQMIGSGTFERELLSGMQRVFTRWIPVGSGDVMLMWGLTKGRTRVLFKRSDANTSSDLVLEQGRSGHTGNLVRACARESVPQRARVEIGSADWKG